MMPTNIFSEPSQGAMLFIVVTGLLAVLPIFRVLPVSIGFYCYDEYDSYLKFVGVFLAMLVHLPLSIAIGSMIGGNLLTWRDFYDLYRPLYYVAVFTFSFLATREVDFVESFWSLLDFIFLLIVVLGLCQYLRWHDPLSFLYTKAHNVVVYRVSAPFVNPYDYAFVMFFYLIANIVRVVYGQIRSLVPLFVAMAMLMLTQSRSVAFGGLLFISIALPVVLIIFNRNVRSLVIMRYFALMIVSAILFIVFFSFLEQNLPYLVLQLKSFFGGGGIGSSGNSRINQINYAFEVASENLIIAIIGNGPNKSAFEFVESIYVYYFYRLGLIGVLLYFVWPMVMVISMLWRTILISVSDYGTYRLALVLLLFILSIPILSVGNNFTEQVRVSFFYYSLLGVSVGIYSRQLFRE